MSKKAIILTIIAGGCVLAVLAGGGYWYFFIGRKPKIVISKVVPDTGEAACRAVGSGEVLLVTGRKVTMIDTAAGREKWSADLIPAPESAPAHAAASTPPPADPRLTRLQQWSAELNEKRATVKTPAEIKAFNEEVAKYRTELNKDRAPSSQGKERTPSAIDTEYNHEEELAEGRLKNQFAKLRRWNLALTKKRDEVKAPLQIEAFNLEAAKYHAELAAARAESARIAGLNRPAPAPAPASTPAKPEPKPADIAVISVEKSDPLPAEPLRPMIAGGQDHLWVVENRAAYELDRQSGRIVKQVGLPGPATGILRGPNAFFVTTEDSVNRQVTRITMADGVSISTAALSRSGLKASDGSAVLLPAAAQCTTYSAAGDTLLEMEAMPAEQKGTEVEGIGQNSYRVTVSHPMGGAAGPWSGMVQGCPAIFSSSTLDFLAAGTQLTAFDRTGKRLWGSQLAQPMATTGESEVSPCLDIAGSVCIYDRASLTAFERGTGKVVWRLPSAGIRKVQADSDGMLYVLAESASAGAPQYSRETGHLVTLKVDPGSGKIVWSASNYDDCFVSGNGIYATRIGSDAKECLLFKLSARDGSPQWEQLQLRRPLKIEADSRMVSLLFRDEFQSLKSLAF